MKKFSGQNLSLLKVYFWPLSLLSNLATGACLTQKIVPGTNPNPFYSMLQLVLKIQIELQKRVVVV